MCLFEYTGCLHVHISPGKHHDLLDEIAYDAKKASLNFLLLTPHTPSSLKHQEYFSVEGYRNNVLILAGEEADEKSGKNHILVYGNKNWLGKKPVETMVSSIKENDLLSFAAHPDGKHRLFGFESDHRWTKRHLLENLSGIEVWSLLFDFSRKTNPSNVVFRYFGFPENLDGPLSSTLKLWDRILEKRKFTGVAGLDIHHLKFGMKYLDIKKTFEYGFAFKVLRNHLLCEECLSGDIEKDIKIIAGAFKKGRLFFANDFLADSKGFFFGSEDKKITMGDSIKIGENLLVKLPEKCDVIIKNKGEEFFHKNINELIFHPKYPGWCRVEAYYKERPWIFSNPIYIDSDLM